MKKSFIFALCIVMLFTFSSGVFATDVFYADEESADGTDLFDGISLFAESESPSIQDGNLVIVLDPGHGQFGNPHTT